MVSHLRVTMTRFDDYEAGQEQKSLSVPSEFRGACATAGAVEVLDPSEVACVAWADAETAALFESGRCQTTVSSPAAEIAA